MSKSLTEAITRAKYLLEHVRNAAMATVNEDGSPHNTPFFFIHDEKLDDVYWCSHPESRHSRNVSRNPQIFVVLYEGNAGGGLYLKANNAHELNGDELIVAMKAHNRLRRMEGRDDLPDDYYTEPNPQRMYAAKITHCYVNYPQRDQSGNFIADLRHEVPQSSLV